MQHSETFSHRPAETLQSVEALLAYLTEAGYSSEMAFEVLGEHGISAAASGAPQAALWHAERSGALDTRKILISAFYLRQPVPRAELAQLLSNEFLEQLIDDGVLQSPDGAPESDSLISAIDIRPISAAAHGVTDILLASDPDSSMWDHVPGTDHVPGVGNAPLSLLGAVPPVADGSSILDLGCGSGVLSAVLGTSANDVIVTGTDISERALEFARVNGAVLASDKNTTLTWKKGNWFEPVDGEQFDILVANPPFVVGPAEVGHVYRDSGMPLDGATKMVVSSAPEFLSPEGTAHILSAWALQDGESIAQRMSSWIPSHGIRAWVLQREIVDPATYVTTWLRDESIDPRHAEGKQRTQQWMDFFAKHDIAQIALGFVHMQRIDDEAPSEITVEELEHALAPGAYLGAEVAEFFARAAWLQDKDAEDVLEARFAVRPTAAVERVSLPQSDAHTSLGFQAEVTRLTRTDGPRWSHEVDEPLLAVLGGLHPEAMSLRDVAELYCAVHGVEEEPFCEALIPLIVDLIRHGIVIPSQLLDEKM